MIKPTVGRVVLFHPPANEAAVDFAPAEICAALVCYVHSDRLVNLAVFDADGRPHSFTSVELIQDGEPAPVHYGRYCEWMPYQKGQAAKTEEAIEEIKRMASAGKPLI